LNFKIFKPALQRKSAAKLSAGAQIKLVLETFLDMATYISPPRSHRVNWGWILV